MSKTSWRKIAEDRRRALDEAIKALEAARNIIQILQNEAIETIPMDDIRIRSIVRRIHKEILEFAANGTETEENMVLTEYDVIDRVLRDELKEK